jgi:uncharacterized protein (TIGR01440 family)
MTSNKQELEQQVDTVMQDLLNVASLGPGKILVIGTSTSEVRGERIGTSGSEDIAEAIFSVLDRTREVYGFQLAFQCCEHLNRALVVERTTAEQFGLDEVSAVPVRKAGGSMAAYAFSHMEDPVLVESIAAHAGIDIGDTLIGMHLRPVAVPVRPSIRSIGNAHVTMAFTRPKLIGGIRAVYERP